MPRRPLLLTVALSTTLLLTGCNNSPEAGRPNTTPPPSTSSPTPTASPTPTGTEEEQIAVAAAKSRYSAARQAIAGALRHPEKPARATLLQAGNGDPWLISVLGELKFQADNGWYQSGNVKITPISHSVKLKGEQPEVDLVSCLDSSLVVTRYQSNDKPVPAGPDDGDRHKVLARMVFAPPAGQTTKVWFLVEEKAMAGKC